MLMSAAGSTTGRPAAVTVSFWIWLVTVLLGILEGVASFVSTSTKGVSTATLVTGAVISIVIALVELFIVFRMRGGRNWARIVLLVLTILQVLSSVTSSTTVAAFPGVVGWIGVVAVVVATVLMFVPGSNPWFRRR